MNHSIQLQKLTHLLHHKNPIFSSQNLLQIHAQLITAGLHSDYSWLLPFFQLCSSNPSTLHHATSIFTHTQESNTPTWRTMICRHASEINPFHAISLFQALQRIRPITPLDDSFIYASLIKACNKLSAIREAKLFQKMPERDLVSWNTMIAGYAKNNDCSKAFSLFREMRIGNIACDRVSLVGLISACTNTRDLSMGKAVHGYIKASGAEATVPVRTALINMYSKCGLIEFSPRVFDELPAENIASWNSMIHGYVECGHFCEALRLFNLIRSRKLIPDEVTMLGLISACRNSGELHLGIRIHSFIESNDHLNGNIVLFNALIDMYAKCGCMNRAKAVFDKMLERDVISWTSIIVGHAINGEGKEALVAFQQMRAEQIEPNCHLHWSFIGM